MSTELDQDNRLSLQSMLEQRSEAFAQIRYLADRLAQIGNAVEQFDMALMTLQTDNSASEQQALVNAARNLATVLGGPNAESH